MNGIFRAVCIAVSLAMAGPTLAQQWCPPGAQWVYDTGNPLLDSEMQLAYAGDTMIDGFPAQRIDRLSRMFWQGTLTETVQPSGFTRTDGDVVWEWNGIEWDTLYWFSALPGDEWQPFWPFGEVCPDHSWHVMDTATIVVDGISLRRIWVELRENGIGNGNWTMITDRIGGGGGFVFPGLAPCGPIFECYCAFVCYRDDQINSNDDCEMTVGASEHLSQSMPFGVSPVPAASAISVTNETGSLVEVFEIYDLSGRLVLRRQLMSTSSVIDISGLTKGWYSYRAFVAQYRLLATGPILKE